MSTPWKLTVLAAALAAGCAAVSPAANERLEQARASYRSAAADPQVQRHAAPELQNAANALKEAERLAKEGGYSELVEHNAYVAERRARTALRTAQARQAEADLLAAREERRRAQAEARERDAAAARAQAQQAEIERQQAEARVKLVEEESARQQLQKAAAAQFAADVNRLEAQAAGVRARQTERGWVLTVGDALLFERGTMLQPGAEQTLDELAQFLKKYRDRNVSIEGFTDASGQKEANERLSERRAEAVKFALVQRGVEPHRIDARGYGASSPVSSNDSESGRQLNRRLEIVISPS